MYGKVHKSHVHSSINYHKVNTTIAITQPKK